MKFLLTSVTASDAEIDAVLAQFEKVTHCGERVEFERLSVRGRRRLIGYSNSEHIRQLQKLFEREEIAVYEVFEDAMLSTELALLALMRLTGQLPSSS